MDSGDSHFPAQDSCSVAISSHREGARELTSVYFIRPLTLILTTGKPTALTTPILVSKAMSLLFNKLSRLVIAFLLRSKRLLILWLQPLSTVILEPKKIKCVTASCFQFAAFYLLRSDGC